MTPETDFDEVVICLFDGEYHLGVAALTNSLVKYQFKGLINVGYRGGVLPLWVKQLQPLSDNYFRISDDVTIHFKQVLSNMHLGYFKPFFIKETFDDYPAAKKFYYFDADIIVQAPWMLYFNWVGNGVCLCLDSAFHFIHHNHPWRKDWRALVKGRDHLLNPTFQYFNSGFLGIDRNNIILIDRWIDITNQFIKKNGQINYFIKDSHSSVRGDQDLLNAVITTSSDIEINVMGKEAMGFSLPATLMLHAIGERKPWNSSFIVHLLKYGNKPSTTDKAFLSICKYPINIFSVFRYSYKKIDLLSACVLGRFLG